MGAALAEKWGPVLTNVENGFQMRMIEDLLAPPPEGGMLFLAMDGKQMGNFDMMYDPQVARADRGGADDGEERSARLTTSGPALRRAARAGKGEKTPAAVWFTPLDFKIDAALDSDLRMKVTTRDEAAGGQAAAAGVSVRYFAGR